MKFSLTIENNCTDEHKKLIDAPKKRSLESMITPVLNKAPFTKSISLNGIKDTLCSLIFVDDDYMAALNSQFRKKDKSTNVLSFPLYLQNAPGILNLGEVYVSLPTTAHEAKIQGKTFDNHFTHLVVHGLLHLLGYDHQQEDEARVMETLEIAILSKIDIPNPYIVL